MKKLRILQFMPEFKLAGAEKMCVDLCIELSKDNIVEVVSFYDIQTSLTKKLEENGIKILYLNKNKGLDLSIIKKIKKIILEFKPDIIHTHRYCLTYVIPATFFKKGKIRIIHTIHNVATKETHMLLRKIQGIYFRNKKIIPVAISDEVKKTIISEYKIKKYDIPMVYNGIDLENCIIKENYKLNGNILHIGRFAEAKNHLKFIERFKNVVRKYPNIKLFLIGDGDLRDKIKNYVKDNKLENNVFLLGLIDNVYPYLYNADLFILPSLYEGMPITLIEAMGTGLPIIATDVGGIPDMIEDKKDGLLIHDINQLDSSIVYLLENKSYREQLGRNALIQSSNFTSKNMADMYLKIYNS